MTARLDDPEDRDAWTRPGAFEVAPGIHRMPLPLPNDGLRAVNVYALGDGDRLTLVDGGWAIEAAEVALRDALDHIGFGLEHVDRFLVTHVHRDHYTNAAIVRKRFGATVSLGAGERPSLDHLAARAEQGGDEEIEVAQVPMLREAGAGALADRLAAYHPPPIDPDEWAAPDEWLRDGQVIAVGRRRLAAIETPGHTSGHMVYHDPAGSLLFAGDHVLPQITPSIGFQPVRAISPLGDYLASLRLVRAMPDARLLPAHGPTTASVHERVDELLAHHAERLDLTLRALDTGAETAFEVAGQLTWTRRRRRLADMDLFNEMLAILETSAHLQVLAERGLVTCEIGDGVRRYRSA
ncbi:MAG: MBL fold metallo-hydrolase [Intrasporangium sp.]|uniref:MBL fold metallo-hydrolase n=1 Tax=Intrasporangium sp. TaxID=1925024 RepID=UPI0026479301|nr:MBL fold metallo-hydrolase [Intrasporangium sp.]MDN5796514.1 MBL fold metallo-hydrolase [Intrasporangium sp.]